MWLILTTGLIYCCVPAMDDASSVAALDSILTRSRCPADHLCSWDLAVRSLILGWATPSHRLLVFPHAWRGNVVVFVYSSFCLQVGLASTDDASLKSSVYLPEMWSTRIPEVNHFPGGNKVSASHETTLFCEFDKIKSSMEFFLFFVTLNCCRLWY